MDFDKSDSVESRASWLKSLSKQLVNLSEISSLPVFIDATSPAWLSRVEQEIGGAMFGKMKIIEGDGLTPKQFGSILGYQCAYAVWMTDSIKEYSYKNEVAKISTDISESQDNPLENWYSGLADLAKSALSSSVDQSYEDMRDFLVGYSNGFCQKPRKSGIGEIGSTAMPIYIFLVMHSKQVNELKSVAELHNLLRAYIGDQITGDLKRVEKICQRIGLSFRKPGRPAKPK